MRDKLYIKVHTCNTKGKQVVKCYKPALGNNGGRCLDTTTKNIKREVK